jgi:hypothetical protein
MSIRGYLLAFGKHSEHDGPLDRVLAEKCCVFSELILEGPEGNISLGDGGPDELTTPFGHILSAALQCLLSFSALAGH